MIGGIYPTGPALFKRMPAMLVLMRRVGESICIGDDVSVKVVSVDRNRVRLGITAPQHVRVDREEVAEKRRLGIGGPTPKRAGSSAA